jgi:CheY-like chemotaxis protein
MHISVRDTGIGIAAEKQERIFKAFEQIDSSIARKFGGTGLGLAISAKLAELMGGRIWFDSQTGRGSTFHMLIRLQLPAGEIPRRFVSPQVDFHGARVLVVDDNESNRRAISETLKSWDMKSLIATDAQTALAMLEEVLDSENDFQLLLIDADMPTTDGLTLAECITEHHPERAKRIVMMLRPRDRKLGVARCEKLGIKAYVMKPVDQSELFDTLIAVLAGESLHEPIRTSVGGETLGRIRGLEVLLAEDSIFNQKLAVGVLKKHGHRVAVADNGRIAVDTAKSRRFDLILMDIQMPEMDGLEATRQIRAFEEGTGIHTPIVAMTAQAMQGVRERCEAAGMDAYLVKPVRAALLYETIESLFSDRLKPRKSTRTTVRSRKEFDWSEALKVVDGDRELLRDVVEGFLEECPQLIASIDTAIEQSDAATLRRAAHTLKGALRTLGIMGAVDFAAKLEEMGRSGALKGAEKTFSRLKKEVEAVMPHVTAFVSGK